MTRAERTWCRHILEWYEKNKRDLPWRKTRKPYAILVSEVMLQQTQVDRVVPKYRAFLRRFPSSRALSQARTSDVITAWQGLGYNRRALYLQKAAVAVQERYGGRFPRTLTELRALPGVGDYTARAVLSFAFDEPVAVLDTNHRKFYRRTFFGDEDQTDAALLEKAESVVQDIARRVPSKAGAKTSAVYDWNQAIMDFMSAVLRGTDRHGTDDPLLVRYVREFPARAKTQEKKKAAVPFRQSNRYFRGRIIDLLRERKSVPQRILYPRFQELGKDRFIQILHGLERDGLILVQKEHIVLP